MTTLLWFLVAIVVGVAVLAPNRGLLARWRHHQAALGREQAENALKHLLGQAAAGESASLSSLQGVLRTSDRELLALTERLSREGLIRTEGDRFRLTSEGERVALHVVRAHRLWELYLADELGVPVGQVHVQAERAEHLLTPADADRLSAAMGHPEIDPHGDPIPERDGELRPAGGTPLSAWPVAAPARIVHLEDEPPLAYAQIAALGLRLGQLVHIVEASPTRIVLSDGESEFTLAPMLAGNVHVAAAADTPVAATDSRGAALRAAIRHGGRSGVTRSRLPWFHPAPPARSGIHAGRARAARPDDVCRRSAGLSAAGHHHRASPRAVCRASWCERLRNGCGNKT